MVSCNNKGCFLVLVMLGLVLSCSVAFADIYQWTDGNGTVHYSDNPGNAPKGKTRIRCQEASGEAANVEGAGVAVSAEHREPKARIDAGRSRAKFASNEAVRGNPEESPVGKFDPAADAEIKHVWSVHRNALSVLDARTALEMIHPQNRKRFAETFTALGDKMSEFASTTKGIQVDEMNGRYATYSLIVREDSTDYSYQVKFLRGDNSKWCIYDY